MVETCTYPASEQGRLLRVTTERNAFGDGSSGRDGDHDRPVGRGLLSIGAFSRASLLSIKVLRAYHEAGILVPADVDPSSGYRYYHWSQLGDAGIIRRLRSLDLPLEQVRQVVQASDPAVTRSVLEQHRSMMQERLEKVARAIDEMDEALTHPASHTPIHLTEVAATHAVALNGKVREADFASFLGFAYPRLDQVVAAAGLSPAGPPGALYPPEISDEVEEVTAYVPVPRRVELTDEVAAPDEPISLQELPAVTCAIAVHSGGYHSIGDTYRLLGSWVAQNADPVPDLAVREVYLVSYGDVEDPDLFRTEIHWPVTAAPGP